jgi:alpha-1,6-mannosyltransferase
MPNQERVKLIVGSVFFLIALVLPTFLIDRTESGWLVLSFLIAFLAYLLVWNLPHMKWLLMVGLLARAGLFFTMPMLSDDVYRFLWDGFLLQNGIHPFAELPSFYLDQKLPGLSQDLFDSLNSQRYFTVYPPINQGLFWLAVNVSEDWLVAAGVIRIFLLAADLIALYFLRKLLLLKGANPHFAFLYFLNPLVIWEGVGNLHFEVMVVAFLVMGLYFFHRNKPSWAASGFGLAVGVKLLPLIYLPYFFFEEIRNRRIWFTLVAGVVAVATFLPMLNLEFIEGLRSSLNLYITNFEFNGSVFAVMRELSIWVTGYNKIKIIGPIFSVLSFFGILLISWRGVRRNWGPEKTLLFVLCLYLVLATTVHPWYILPLILFGLLSGYVFPIVWSLMIFVTYVGYSSDGHSLHWAWSLIEYSAVAVSFIFNERLKKWLIIS